MASKRATVTCPDCDLDEEFDKLAAARERIEDHRTEAGHEAIWKLDRLSAGVERAGDEAGICGREGCGDKESALFQDDL